MAEKDYTKPMMFRPSDKDTEALQLIAEKNPVLAENASDLLRIALQDYVFNHGPQSGRSKSVRLDKVEERLSEHGVLLNEHSALLRAICERIGVHVQ